MLNLVQFARIKFSISSNFTLARLGKFLYIMVVEIWVFRVRCSSPFPGITLRTLTFSLSLPPLFYQGSKLLLLFVILFPIALVLHSPLKSQPS